MFKTTIILNFVFSALIFTSCTQTITSDKILYRYGKYYEINSDKPYKGKVIQYSEEYKDKDGPIILANAEIKNGLTDGAITYYYNNGQKKTESKYKEGKELSRNEWHDNGAKYIEQTSIEGKLIKQSRLDRNGKLIIDFTNDVTKPIARMDFLCDDDEIKEGTCYYQNDNTFPIEPIFDAFGSSLDDIDQKFGKSIKDKDYSTLYSACHYNFLSLIETDSKFETKSQIFYIFYSSNDSSAAVSIRFWPASDSLAQIIVKSMNSKVESYGFVQTQDEGIYECESKKFIIQRLKQGQTIDYTLYRNVKQEN